MNSPASPHASGASSRRPAPRPPTAPTSCAARASRSSTSWSASRTSTRRRISAQLPPRPWTQGATRYTLLAGTVGAAPGDRRQAGARERPRPTTLNEIIVTNGAKSAIYSALRCTLEPGDEVIIPAPYWVSYPDMVLACDGVPGDRRLPRRPGLQAHAGAARSGHHADETRWLLINSPSQSDRRQLHRGRIPRAGRRACAPSRTCW